MFETERDALKWYESEPRLITPEFVNSIPWQDVKNHPFDASFIPIMSYMRDVEVLTPLYHRELLNGPAGKIPAITSFMDRWQEEEPRHGELLNRFMEEAGYPSEKDWQKTTYANVPLGYRLKMPVQHMFTKVFGSNFGAVHMTWGAIQEYTTMTAYRRLWTLAKHPVLEHILKAIAREETRHALFYWSVARIQLRASSFRQRLARFLVENFWTPVGQGSKLKKDTDHVARTLFADESGLHLFDQSVTSRIASLPGFDQFTFVTEYVKRIART